MVYDEDLEPWHLLQDTQLERVAQAFHLLVSRGLSSTELHSLMELRSKSQVQHALYSTEERKLN